MIQGGEQTSRTTNRVENNDTPVQATIHLVHTGIYVLMLEKSKVKAVYGLITP